LTYSGLELTNLILRSSTGEAKVVNGHLRVDQIAISAETSQDTLELFVYLYKEKAFTTSESST